MESAFKAARLEFHKALLEEVLFTSSSRDARVPANADKCQKLSVVLASAIVERLGVSAEGDRLPGQTSGKEFERLCCEFLKATFLSLEHLRPGIWSVEHVTGRDRLSIARFEQFQHLRMLDEAARTNPELAAVLGSDYTITPDIVISREPEDDPSINASSLLVDDSVVHHSPLRARNNPNPILHASISCKWTIRSDRAQNSRSEALNLVKNRKGSLPHIMVITAEPLPSRLASIALGTGEIDCVYHFALPELLASAAELENEEACSLLSIMVDGRRLRDISDLPLDLAI